MKIAAFDLEIAKPFPDSARDLRKYGPLGISCAGLAFDDEAEVLIWQGIPRLTKTECQAIVRDLQDKVSAGYTLVTWNGCAFDFFVLAQESDLFDECGELALNHIDLMLMVTFTKGHFLGLAKALEGAGLPGKLKQLTLSDGTVVQDMSGAKAPGLWAAGEHDAVVQYLRRDVAQLLRLAAIVRQEKAIRWISDRGNPQYLPIESLLPVRKCFKIPKPDISWMACPPKRKQFINWIPRWRRQLRRK